MAAVERLTLNGEGGRRRGRASFPTSLSPMQKSILQIPGFSAEQNACATLAALDVDLEEIGRELHFRQQRKRARVEREMALAAKARGTTRIIRGIDGVGGQMDLHIHPESFHYWGQRLGYDCWDDKQFVAEYKRDNPASRPLVRNDRTTILVERRYRARKGLPQPDAMMSQKKFMRVRGRRGRWAA